MQVAKCMQVAETQIDLDVDLVANGFVEEIEKELHPDKYANAVNAVSDKVVALSQLNSDKAGLILGKLAEKTLNSDNAEASTREPSTCDGTESIEFEGESAEIQEKAFWDAVKLKNFNFQVQGKKGNPMAGRFQRYLAKHPKQKKLYDQLQGDRKAQAKWRQKWARKMYDEYQEMHSEVVTDCHTDFKEARYRALARIAVEEGGGATGMRAAINYAMCCLMMGGPWVKYDSWTKAIKFLYKEEGTREEFSRAWATHREWRCKSKQADGSSNAPSLPSAPKANLCDAEVAFLVANEQREVAQAVCDIEAAHKVATEQPEVAKAVCDTDTAQKEAREQPEVAQAVSDTEAAETVAYYEEQEVADAVGDTEGAQGSATGQKRPGGKGRGKGSKRQRHDTQEKSPLQLQMQNAKLTKALYASTMSQANSLKRQIHNDSAWSWANNPFIVQELTDSIDNVESVLNDLFFTEIIAIEELAELKQKYAKIDQLDLFEEGLQKFVTEVTPLVEKVSAVCRIKVGQHQARLNALEKKHKVSAKAS